MVLYSDFTKLHHHPCTKHDLMKDIYRFLAGIFLCLISGSIQLNAQFDPCTPANSQIDIDINNVRARLLGGGDMWWDLNSAQYEIPKGSGKQSLLASGIWMGGIDAGGQLHVSASTYRQTGVDFFPGPLDTISGGTNDQACNYYDAHWKVDRAEVESFIENRIDPNYVIPESILNWPGNGNATWGMAHILAPFYDADGDTYYDARKGDYPDFRTNGANDCNNSLLGDQAVWWVFNDKGGVHTNTDGLPLGFEIQATAFAYRSSNDKLNDATFYRFKLINRSTNQYHDMWYANWYDSDLGEYSDDYVGCDVARGLGYTYNGDANDGSSANPSQGTYGAHPPAIGIDYLTGPLAEAGDMQDNDHDYIIDEVDERLALSVSMYYDGGFDNRGYPISALEHYNYLTHHWKDGAPLTYGSYGYGGQHPCKYFFPGNSDPVGWGTYGLLLPAWDEVSEGNMPSDRRQLNSLGPFTMEPGEVEVITVGVPWARDTNGNHLDAVDRLKEADDYIQTLFDNCFSLPCADQQIPEVESVVNNKLVWFTLYADGTSWLWNFGDGGTSTVKHASHIYTNPGIYNVSVQVNTPCGTLYAYDTIVIEDQLYNAGPRITRLEGSGNGNQEMEFTSQTISSILNSANNSILHPEYEPLKGPVKVTYEDYDALEDGDYRLALDSTHNGAGWKLWKVGGSDTVYSNDSIVSGKLQRTSIWGLGIQLKQVPSPGYQKNPDRNGYLSSSVSFSGAQWLTGIKDDDSHSERNWIRAGTAQGSGTCVVYFNDRYQSNVACDANENYEKVCNGFWAPYRIASYAPQITQTTICYEAGPAWSPSPFASTSLNKLENIANVNVVITNDTALWTRCPVIETGTNTSQTEGGTIPFMVRSAPSVDHRGRTVNTGGFSSPNDPMAADYNGATGMGWFPGYAINLETGERLNMAFGENSALPAENGRDMKWNPTTSTYTTFGSPLWGGMHYIYIFNHNGDAHFTNPSWLLSDIPKYDAGFTMRNIFNLGVSEMRQVYSDCIWTTIPIVDSGHACMESDVTIKLRVQKPYVKFRTDSVAENNTFPLYGFRIQKNDLGANMYDNATRVYPNPFWEECIVEFNNIHYHNAELKLYDLNGKLVRVQSSTNDRILISSAGLQSGVYIWHLQVEGEEPETGRVIFNPLR